MIGDNEQKTSLIIYFADVTTLSFEKSAPAAAAVLEVQQQFHFELIQIVALPICNVWHLYYVW